MFCTLLVSSNNTGCVTNISDPVSLDDTITFCCQKIALTILRYCNNLKPRIPDMHVDTLSVINDLCSCQYVGCCRFLLIVMKFMNSIKH